MRTYAFNMIWIVTLGWCYRRVRFLPYVLKMWLIYILPNSLNNHALVALVYLNIPPELNVRWVSISYVHYVKTSKYYLDINANKHINYTTLLLQTSRLLPFVNINFQILFSFYHILNIFTISNTDTIVQIVK